MLLFKTLVLLIILKNTGLFKVPNNSFVHFQFLLIHKSFFLMIKHHTIIALVKVFFFVAPSFMFCHFVYAIDRFVKSI